MCDFSQLNDMGQALSQFEDSQEDWSIFRDHEKREMHLILQSLISFKEGRLPERSGLVDTLTTGDDVRNAHDALIKYKSTLEDLGCLTK